MTTASDIITAAFNKIGVYSPTAAQQATAFTSLNNMISFWGVEGMQHSVTSESFSLVSGVASYTIGSGGDFDTVRPIGIKNCFLRRLDFDHRIRIISPVDYNVISLKSSESKPDALYFLPEYPLAKVIFNCKADYDYEAHFEFLKPFTEFASASEDVSLPPEYKEALIYNAAITFAEDWDRKAPDSVVVKANQKKDALNTLNAALNKPPTARFDFHGSTINIITGEQYGYYHL